MVSTVDSEQQSTVAMLSQWVEQNSGTMNFAGVKRVGDMTAKELQPLGFKLRWIDMSKAGRSGHLIAYHHGRGKKLLIIGHLDTVFEPTSPFQHWQANGESATGPGVIDDKGGMAVIVAALRAMKAAGTLKKADVTVYLGGDEEEAGEPLELARGDLIREISADAADAGQPSAKASISRPSSARRSGPRSCSPGSAANDHGRTENCGKPVRTRTKPGRLPPN